MSIALSWAVSRNQNYKMKWWRKSQTNVAGDRTKQYVTENTAMVKSCYILNKWMKCWALQWANPNLLTDPWICVVYIIDVVRGSLPCFGMWERKLYLYKQISILDIYMLLKYKRVYSFASVCRFHKDVCVSSVVF